jgi:dynein heavy chain
MAMVATDKSRPFPTEGCVYDYCWSMEEMEWTPWMSTISEYIFDTQASFAELIVPTMDSVRYTYLLDLLITHDKHVLMVGPTGTGKSVNVQRHLASGFGDKYVPLNLNFSAQTGANQTQDTIDGKCEKRKKGVFGPAAGKQYILFVDDVNMPQKEEYGAQPPIEILRQWFDNGGWFDRKSLVFRNIIDFSFVCACGPPGGGRNHITARFVRHFNQIAYTPMQDESMERIFLTILDGFLQTNGFMPEVQAMSKGMVSATISIYNTILDELRPTPAKCHYTYNLRDVAKVFQGCLMMSKSKVMTGEDISRIWVHECTRQLGDRLINEEDQSWFREKINVLTKTHLNFEYSELVTQTLVCGDYMIPGADPRVYEEIKHLEQLQPTVEEYLSEYNADSKAPMKLVLFMDAIAHVSRISRVIRQPQGNALLLGVGGSGRQSLTKLATFMAEFDLFQIEISKGYGLVEWRDNLRECLLLAGVEDKPVVFLFNDVQVVFEQMLEDVNGILNAGDVPNLYRVEDMEAINQACKAECVKKRIPPTKINIYSQFIFRVRSNIHVVMCMSPIGDAFRTRLRMFPAFSNCCTIDWFTEWPDDALQHVAITALTEEDLKLGEQKDLDAVVTFTKSLHQSVSKASKDFLAKARRYNYVTPTSFLELLATYKQLLGQKRQEVGTMKDRLQIGLDKLISTADQVAVLKVQLIDLEPVLIKTQGEVDEMIVQIGIDKEAANITKEAVSVEEASATAKAIETKAIADDAQRDLDEALPALDAAVQCLAKLKKADLDEVKGLKKPPDGVKLTLEATCIMFGVSPVMVNNPQTMKKEPDYWQAAQQTVLSNANKLLVDLREFDKDNIPDKVITKIEPYIADPRFTPTQIEKASKACTAVCMWVRAMHKYHNVAKAVEPKKKLLLEAQTSLDATRAALKVAQDKLRAVEDRIATLEANFNKANDKKEQLVNDVEACRGRLERAEKLIGGLGGERVRWTESCKTLGEAYSKLIGDVLVSSGFVAYLGPFTPTFRAALAKDWQEQLVTGSIAHTPGCDLRETLSDSLLVRQWALAGLPSDGLSIENGIIISKARRWPLLMDPQGQANRYIKNMGKDPNFSENGLDVTKLTDKNFLRALENGVRFGKWVLLENILEHLDASLETLLLQQKFVQGGTVMIKIGDSTIPWNESFRFFMTTKLPNPHYAPEVCVKVSLLNFAITPAGLEDQLLGVTVVEELPEMEEKKNALVVSNARMKKQLSEIEDKILYMLSNSQGNILDDVELIETLATSKVTSNEIKIKVAEAETTEKVIDETRELYRPIAFQGAVLYFLVANLALVDPMYQYSLQWFTNLFIYSINNSEKVDDVQARITILNDYLMYYIYVNICRSLFEKDKLLFSFLMAIKVQQSHGQIDSREWAFLMSGKAAAEKTLDNPSPDWIDGRTWSEILNFSTLDAFDGFETDFVKQLQDWQAIFDHIEPQSQPLPGKWEGSLGPLQKLCVLRALRADKVTEGIQNYVMNALEKKFIEPPPFDLGACYTDSTTMTPLIFILSTGSDPTKVFYKFAATKKMDRKLKGLSLGQGQGPIAAKMLEDGTSMGTWVYLQNCHLYVSWMAELERIVEDFSPETVHKDFRLWLTSMPTKGFPVSILQNGVKMTNEPPRGLRANLRAFFFKMDDDKLNATSRPYEYKKMLFGLTLFHAVAQERRKFGALGWNIPYAFNDTDLDICTKQLEMYLDAYEQVPYKVLHYLTSFVNYGGRVTDAKDIRTIDVVMAQFYQESVLKVGHNFGNDDVFRVIELDEEQPKRSFMQYIDGLPLNAGPDVFGMHENANIACAQAETFSTFGTILLMEASGGGGGGDGGDSMVATMCSSIQSTLPPCFDMQDIQMQYPVKYEESMNTVLMQECIRYNKLLFEMASTLPALQDALAGLVVMSGELEAMSNSIKLNGVPDAWVAKAYPSLKPLASWNSELLERVQFIVDWVRDGIPIVFWISGFYFPQAFLTGTLQNYARKHQLPIDTIESNHIVEDQEWDEFTEKPEDGAYIRGLYMEGARWDAEINSINDSIPKQLYTNIPVIHLEPEQNREPPTEGVYQCPVYKTLLRAGTLSTTGHSTNFVMWLEIPSNRHDFVNCEGASDQRDWVLAGVGAFCSLQF